MAMRISNSVSVRILASVEVDMDTEEIIRTLESRRDSVEKALAILRGSNQRPKHTRRRHHFSAAALRRISLAQKKRWAEQKKAKAAS
jgi:hypothetical protein